MVTAKLKSLWKRYKTLKYPESTSDDRLQELVWDLYENADYLAGYLHTYIFYGKYRDERKHVDLRKEINLEIDTFKEILNKLNSIKKRVKDKKRMKEIIDYIIESINLSTKILEEKRE